MFDYHNVLQAVPRRWNRTVGLDQRSLRLNRRGQGGSILAAQGEIAVASARPEAMCPAALHVGRQKRMTFQFLALAKKVNRKPDENSEIWRPSHPRQIHEAKQHIVLLWLLMVFDGEIHLTNMIW